MGKLVTEPNKIIIVDTDVWTGMYLNGKMEYQSHKLGIKNFVSYCIINEVDLKNVTFYDLNKEGEEWFKGVMLLPKFFNMIDINYLERRL